MVLFITIIVSVLLVSGFSSGSEAALFSISKSKVEALAMRGGRKNLDLKRAKDNIRKSITALVILNNIANIAGSIAVGILATQIFGTPYIGIVSAVMTFAIIMFSEIIPKTMGERYSHKIGPLIAPAVIFLTIIFSPIVWMVDKLLKPLRGMANQPITSEEEIKILTRLGQKEGIIEKDERELIDKVFRMNDKKAIDIMTSKNDMVALPTDFSVKQAMTKLSMSSYSRIPVYNGQIGNIIGVVFLKDIVHAIAKDQHTMLIDDIKKPAIFVSGDEKVDSLLQLFQKEKQHLFLVKDEKKEILGLVSLEDVLEELVGEIYDEKDMVKNLHA